MERIERHAPDWPTVPLQYSTHSCPPRLMEGAENDDSSVCLRHHLCVVRSVPFVVCLYTRKGLVHYRPNFVKFFHRQYGERAIKKECMPEALNQCRIPAGNKRRSNHPLTARLSPPPVTRVSKRPEDLFRISLFLCVNRLVPEEGGCVVPHSSGPNCTDSEWASLHINQI